MKALIKFKQHNTGEDADNLHSQYQQVITKRGTDSKEYKKNLLLTPFLLSLPVIIILFSLISGTTAEVPDTISDEPIRNELVLNEHTEPLRRNALKSDTSLTLKAVSFPTRK